MPHSRLTPDAAERRERINDAAREREHELARQARERLGAREAARVARERMLGTAEIRETLWDCDDRIPPIWS